VQVVDRLPLQTGAVGVNAGAFAGCWVMVKLRVAPGCESVPVRVMTTALSSLVEVGGLGGTAVGKHPPALCVSYAPMSEPSPPVAFGYGRSEKSKGRVPPR